MVTVTVNACTGIEKQNEAKDVVVFPNPNHGEFSLNINQTLHKAELRIINTIGQLVYSQVVQSGENKIKTKTLANGVYYYSVIENEKIIAQGKLHIE